MSNKTLYIYNNDLTITVKGRGENLGLSIDIFKDALEVANNKIDLIDQNVPELFGILGMRNLSAFVGEIFVSDLVKTSNGFLVKNPHQDGYPDLLLMTKEGKTLFESLVDQNQDKKPFSGFITGGIEVKATCGSVPTPAVFKKKGLRKPDIGDERINYSSGYDWKAHHRETNNLIGIYWDFINRKPIICGLFFSGELTEGDWGKIIQPKVGGGRTTSVSIMTREGVYKMYSNWIAVINDIRYINLFNKFNRETLIVAP